MKTRRVGIMVQINEHIEEVFLCAPLCTPSSIKDCSDGFSECWKDYPGYIRTFALDYETGEVVYETLLYNLFQDDESGEQFYVLAPNKREAYKIAKEYFSMPQFMGIDSDIVSQINGFDVYT